MKPVEGYDGPYDAPVTLPSRKVAAEWIDYNGHMNVAYYTMAIDQALDLFLEQELGIGESHAGRVKEGPYALQSHIHYLGELLEGEQFTVTVRLIDCDAKRMHLFLQLISENQTVAATCEQMLMNVDLETRKSTPYPDWARARMATMLESHASLENPPQLGASIGIRRKG